MKSVIESLNSVCLTKMTSTDEEWLELDMDSSGKKFILSNYLKLVKQLKAQDKLPALVFRYDFTSNVFVGSLLKWYRAHRIIHFLPRILINLRGNKFTPMTS